jgi:predicted N-formylglutamate amidohydrolase
MKPTESAFDPVETVDGNYGKGLILVCDHASNKLPPEYGLLGLEPDQFQRHIAYDIGARNVTLGLAERLGVPAVMSTYSRLLIDPNRGEDDPTVVMKVSDGAIIRGNHPLDGEELQRRLERYHRPYHRAIDLAIDRALESGAVPAIFSVHSFTDRWRDIARIWEVAVLWDSDARFTKPLLEELRGHGDLVVGDNEPYDGALRNDTMFRHGTARGLAHTLIEIRQDLIRDKSGAENWALRLAPILDRINGIEQLHEIRHFGSRTGPVANQTGAIS